MDADNPYRAPSTPVQAMPEGRCWRDGKWLMAQHGATLPARCVKCAASARLPLLVRKFQWHPSYFYVLLLLNVLVYVVVALIVRKRVEIRVGLCERHVRARAVAILASTAGTLLGVGTIIGGVASDRTWLAVVGAVLAIAAVAMGLVRARTLVPVRIADGTGRFSGCSPEFLALLEPDSLES